ncbi:hypothetical protein NDU88_005822 [Pleurodeles waltl]|uniref:Uncharacterized protein n=1 Tax=Pleurodeles waltl TaxID=8319 RepID=A0AAV7SMQ6_PLEWA|nr:hypothetical protein NDU88_005822 [Pleurodeles waltl]
MQLFRPRGEHGNKKINRYGVPVIEGAVKYGKYFTVPVRDGAPRPVVRYPGGTIDCRNPETPTFNPDVRVWAKRKDGLTKGAAFEEEDKEEEPNEGPKTEQPHRETGMTSGEEEEPAMPQRDDARPAVRTSCYNSRHVPGAHKT